MTKKSPNMAKKSPKISTSSKGTHEKSSRSASKSGRQQYSASFLIAISLIVAFTSSLLSIIAQAYFHEGLFLDVPSIRSLFFPEARTVVRHNYIPYLPQNFTDVESFRAGYVCRHFYSSQVLHRAPLVVLFENFLQSGEADYIKAIARSRMKKSTVAESADDYYHESDVRTSSSAFLKKAEDPIVACVEQRASLITGIDLYDCEPLQVVHYLPGQKYEPHFDYFPREDLKDYWSQRSGQRYATLLAYMDDEMTGGNTVFPKLKLGIAPVKNAAVMWFNVEGSLVEDPRTLHGGAPVETGEKWAINIWQRKKIPNWDNGKSWPGMLDDSVV